MRVAATIMIVVGMLMILTTARATEKVTFRIVNDTDVVRYYWIYMVDHSLPPEIWPPWMPMLIAGGELDPHEDSGVIGRGWSGRRYEVVFGGPQTEEREVTSVENASGLVVLHIRPRIDVRL